MIRGPGKDTTNHPNTRKLLNPLLSPAIPSSIFANYPLENYGWLAFLNEYYVMQEDFGDRFKPLRVLPARWDHGWPRYLYTFRYELHATPPTTIQQSSLLPQEPTFATPEQK